MHYQSKGLPADVREAFFSDRFYYAASQESRLRGRGAGRARYVGSAMSLVDAIADMRLLAAGGRTTKDHPLP